MPQPRLPSSGQVLVKLSDFSISRVLSPIGTKGFAGTEGKETALQDILRILFSRIHCSGNRSIYW
jgi:hypothetical protein